MPLRTTTERLNNAVQKLTIPEQLMKMSAICTELNLRRHKGLASELETLNAQYQKAEDLPLIMLSDWKKARKPLLRSLLNTTANGRDRQGLAKWNGCSSSA